MRMHRRRARLCLAASAGMIAFVSADQFVRAQQNLNNPTVVLSASDAADNSSFAGGPIYNWSASSDASRPAGSAPTTGYAYVVTGNAAGTNGLLGTPSDGSVSYTFAGASLTILPYNGQANLYASPTDINAQDTTASLAINGDTSGQTIWVPNLVLGNGGAVINYSHKATTINGSIDLLPAGTTLDGITTTTSGGIIDAYYANPDGTTINATLSGSGQLHVLATGSSDSQATVTLAGDNRNFSGGVLLDSTVGTGDGSGSATWPVLNLTSPTALGTGTFVIALNNPDGTGPTLDNPSLAPLTLTTNMVQQWNGNFEFRGTGSLNMGSGAVTLNASSVTVTLAGDGGSGVLTIGSISGAGKTLSLLGGGNSGSIYGTLEVPNRAAMNVDSLFIDSGVTLAFPAASNTPAQFATEAANDGAFSNGALMGIDTTGVAGGVYNFSSNLPSGSYGINKLGPGTLVLSGNDTYTGFTVISQGTLQLGSANALPNPANVNFGPNGAIANGTLDLNGFSATLAEPNGGGAGSNSAGGFITNTNSAHSVLTLTNSTAFESNTTYFGSITGNLSVVYAYPAVTDQTTEPEAVVLEGSTYNYSGTSTLASGVFTMSSTSQLPSTPQQVIFSGGILKLDAANLDPSATFNQSAGQTYNITIGGSYSSAFHSSMNSPGGSLTVGAVNAYLDSPLGTLVLAAPNQYTGPTNVLSSVLQLANKQAVAQTSGVTVQFNQGFAASSPVIAGTLQINDSSGSLGLTGGTTGGTPIPLYLNGMGSAENTLFYTTGFGFGHKTYYYMGQEYFGALQGTPGATGASADVWAGNIILASQYSADSTTGLPWTGISGGFNGSGGTLKITGVISGQGPLVLGLNPGSTTILAAANTYTDETQLTCATGGTSTVQLGANAAIPASSGLNFANNNGPLANANGASFTYQPEILDLNGYNTSTAYVTSSTSQVSMFVANSSIGAVSNNGVITNTQVGTTSTLSILGTNSSPYLGVFQDGAAGAKLALNFNSPGTVFNMTGSNNYSGGTTITAGVLVVSNLSAIGTTLTGGGNITVNANAILQQTSASAMFAKLKSGYANGNWNGSGINSSLAASDSTHLLAVGMLSATGGGNFEGQPLSAGDVALKLTYYGDATLDGQVNSADYTLIDGAYLNNSNPANAALTGWQNGDFNYDGVINGSDYTLIDNAFNMQGAQIQTSIASPTAQLTGVAAAAVPEPTSFALMAVGMAGLLGRRRKH